MTSQTQKKKIVCKICRHFCTTPLTCVFYSWFTMGEGHASEVYGSFLKFQEKCKQKGKSERHIGNLRKDLAITDIHGHSMDR